MIPGKLNLAEVTVMDEDQARKYIEAVVWPNRPVWPHCGGTKAWDIKEGTARAGVYECSGCGKQFTVTVGTIMESSHISLRQWLIAFHLMTSSKKGVSALQLKRNLGLGSYKSAWFMAHRIRHAMKDDPVQHLLKGVVEVDETYVGGKPPRDNEKKNKRGRGTDKAPVVALVERDGKSYSKPIENVNAKTLKGAIRDMVDKDSTIMTDEWKAIQELVKNSRAVMES